MVGGCVSALVLKRPSVNTHSHTGVGVDLRSVTEIDPLLNRDRSKWSGSIGIYHSSNALGKDKLSKDAASLAIFYQELSLPGVEFRLADCGLARGSSLMLRRRFIQGIVLRGPLCDKL